MHIYCLTRGILSASRQWANDLAAQYLPFEWKEADGKIVKGLAQLQVRPVQLYEIVCPKEAEAQVMGMLKPGSLSGFAGMWGKPIRLLMKLLGLKKPLKNWKPYIIPPGHGVNVMVLGTKDDKTNWGASKPTDLIQQGGLPKEML